MRIYLIALIVLVINGHWAEAQAVQAYATVGVSEQTYSYTLYNGEPTGSPNYVTNFYLTVQAPVSVTGTPDGWIYSSGAGYVLWLNNDPSLPYPHDIAPGASLSGFSIMASGPVVNTPALYQIISWDHNVDAPGPNSSPARILVPSEGTSAVPEPSSLLSLGVVIMGLIGLIIVARIRSRRAKRM